MIPIGAANFVVVSIMGVNNLTYTETHPITRPEADSAFTSNDPHLICVALVNLAFHEPEWRWVQDRCVEFAVHPDPNIRGLAAACLGHLARIHGQLDLDKVTPLLQQLLLDQEVLVRGRTQDAIADIKIYMKCEVS